MESQTSTGLGYRPDIDGLRAISVLAVLIYHAQISFFGFSLFPGGFLGVDVFFTVSGFVITKAALQEFDHTGKFSLSQFYIRRARRLIPALVAMIAVSTIFAWWILLPSQLIDFSKSTLYALSFLSNFYWLDTLTAYGAESSQLKPLLHTWTLAVEEQFYIVYPLLLLLLLPQNKPFQFYSFAIISLTSLAAMFIVRAENWEMSFYSLPTRLWEILLGAGVATASSQRVKQISSIRAESCLSLGLILVFLPLLLGSLRTEHPGLVTITISLGTSVVLFVAPASTCVRSALTNPVFIYLGLRSYSIYIWHFPVFSFYRNYYYDYPPSSTALLLLLTLFLSEISYRLIEMPFRTIKSRLLSQLSIFLLILIAGILVISVMAIKTDGFKSRFPDLIKIYGQNEFDNALLKRRSNSIRRNLAKQAGAESWSDHEQSFRWFTGGADTLKILIVGNSHAKNLFIALRQNNDRSPKMEFAMYRMQIDSQEKTVAQLIEAKNFMAADIILISTNFREDVKRNDLKALPHFVDKMESMGKTVVLTSNSPKFINYSADTIFDRLTKTGQERLTPQLINATYFKSLDASVFSTNAQLLHFAEQRNLVFLNKFDFSCNLPKSTCTGITPEGFKAYFDGEHYTVEGARHFGRVIHDTGWLSDIYRK